MLIKSCKTRAYTLFFLIIFLWSGCTTVQNKSSIRPPKKSLEKTTEQTEHSKEEQEEAPPDGPIQGKKSQVTREGLLTDAQPKAKSLRKESATKQGTQRAARKLKPSAGEGIPSKQGKVGKQKKKQAIQRVVLNFDNADIYEVIKTIAQILDINYIIDPAVKGTVNIRTRAIITKEGIFDIFRALLKVNGAAILKEGDLYHVIPTQNANTRLLIPKVGQDESKLLLQDKIVLQVVQPKFISATEASKVLKPFISTGAVLTVYEKNNLILVTDFATNLGKLLKILDLIDANLFEKSKFRIYPIQEADVQEVSDEIQKIFSALEFPSNNARGIGVSFIPIPRINALLVITSVSQVLEEVEKWVKELDREESKDDVRNFVYHVKNGISSELAEILSAIFVQQKGKRKLPVRGKRPSPFTKQKKSPAKKGVNTSRPVRTNIRNPTFQGTVSGDVFVIPYPTTNTIIIKATPRDYRLVIEVLDALDILQRQVLIDVLIAEITLTDESSIGVEAAFRGETVKRSVLAGSAFGLSGPGALVTGGLTSSVINGNFQGVLNALASENRVDILASPHIIAADGKEASIDIGDEVPLVASKIFIDQREEITIERRNTGVILKVNPHINNTGLVTLDIMLELSDASSAAVEGESDIRIFKRSTKTTMVVQDGQTVIIGGLINEKEEEVSTKVPFLGDIPILGFLFRNTKKVMRKTELVLVLTPHVIKSLEEANDVTSAFIEKLKVLKDRLPKNGDQS